MNFEQQIRKQAQEFLLALSLDLDKAGVVLEKSWWVDHLCYRTRDLQEYEVVKSELLKFSKLLTESAVNGRPIATYKLSAAIRFAEGHIDVIEVPAPKKGKLTQSGFEHFEVVCDIPLAELQKRFQHLKLDLGGLQKSINPDLEICLGDRSIKFHSMSLEQAILLENQE